MCLVAAEPHAEMCGTLWNHIREGHDSSTLLHTVHMSSSRTAAAVRRTTRQRVSATVRAWKCRPSEHTEADFHDLQGMYFGVCSAWFRYLGLGTSRCVQVLKLRSPWPKTITEVPYMS